MKQPSSTWTPVACMELLKLAGDHGWHAQIDYRTPAYLVMLWQARRDGTLSRFCYVVEYRNRGGWKPVCAREEIDWGRDFVTERDVSLAEVRGVVRGL